MIAKDDDANFDFERGQGRVGGDRAGPGGGSALRRRGGLRPEHGAIAACLAAAAALAGSQFVDYRAIGVGASGYGEVEAVATAPQIDRRSAGEAHAWVGLPLAALAALLVAMAVAGRRRAAVLLAGLGLGVIALTLVVDRPAGLDPGEAALAYEGAEATLLEGFWAQLAAGTVLAVCGALLAVGSRPRRRRARPGRRRPAAKSGGARGRAPESSRARRADPGGAEAR